MPERPFFVPSAGGERGRTPSRAARFERESNRGKIRRAGAIAAHLAKTYPGLVCPLEHRSDFELLIAVILSAQCTDAAVNKVTPALFRRFPTPAALAKASTEEIESLIRSLGLFRAKARALKRCAQQLLDEFAGEVPCSMNALTGLTGVGRKTANVIRGHAFGLPGIAVDTHCRRVAQRLCLTRSQDPVKIEADLGTLLPAAEWTGFSHRLILHGRAVCHARSPGCDRCTLSLLCPTRKAGVQPG